ncbi:hotdog fold thioesterase [Lentibacillus salicampi]|uniref:Hotdog fold thioesterase n=1 Tax=Lentibacillus salicampi TaxID=175306 RepID=A0A4Y9AAJ6_9BACI|nr:hotdog fold thioesterase [Lentibacillus salicampi]TFJ92803.1 hotdog fold thioesterase [Lentibacillus salicampi]
MAFENTLMESLGIETVTLDEDRVVMKMPVDRRTLQPAGFLHGGANVALAETAASVGATLNADLEKFNVFGIEINANHIKSKREGTVTATAEPIHKGKKTMVWGIRITDEHDHLICTSRCTIAIVHK